MFPNLKNLIKILLIVLSLLSSVNAADLYVVAVFDLKAETGVSDQDALLLSKYLRKDLAATHKITVMDRNDMKQVLTEQGQNLQDCTEEGCAVKLGRLLDSDKIIVGSISKLGGRFVLYAKMVDLETGAMMFAKDVQASDNVEDLPRYIKDLSIKIADEIQLRGKVLNITGDEVLVDLGSDVGIKQGATMMVNRQGDAIRDPMTNEVKGYNWAEVAQLRVIGFSGLSISKCQIISSKLTILPNDRVTEFAFAGIVKAKGEVVFNISPGDVYLVKDGTPSGIITVPESGRLKMQLSPGNHTFAFSRQGMRDWDTEVVVRAGETQQVQVDFRSGQSQIAEASGYGILVIRSEPSGAAVFIDGVERGPTTYQAKQIAAGTHTVEIQKPLYKPYLETITVASDDILEVSPTLEPDFGKLTINSNPSGAMVYIDGQQKGLTPHKVERFLSGEYDLRLVKQLYHENIQKFTIQAGGQTPISVDLRPAFGSLRVTSNPSGARVTVDEQFWGTTPAQKDTVLSGQHSVLVQQELFNDFEQTVTVSDGQQANVNAVLNKNFGTIDISSNPSGADIFIVGQAGKFGNTPLKRNLQPGIYRLQIQKDLYETYEQTVNLTIGDVQRINQDLVRKTGRLVIFTDPPDAEVFLDGKRLGKSPQIVKAQPTGTYEVILKMSGYGEVRKTVEVKYKEEVKIDEKITRTAYIAKMKRKKKTLIISTFAPGMGQTIASKQTAKGILYFAAFAGTSYLAYDSYSKYTDAESAYNTASENYLTATFQTTADAEFAAMQSAYDDMESFDSQHKMFLMATGGIWAWNMIDALIWGGGKAETFSHNLGDSEIQFTALYNRIGLTVKF